jgi:glycosyltransferase, family 2
MENEIDVSFVMTVYNKEYYLPSVIRALLNQTGLKNPEYIFVDDVSTDKSVEIIREMTKGIKNVKIFANTENRGISVRINQGIAAAEGKYTRMLDSDDIFPLDSTQKMVQLAEELSADMVYGTFTKTGKEPTELEHEFMNDNFTYDFDKDALRTVLTGRFTRMGQLIRTEVLQKAGGADERVFIQDESIPLRAALHARGIVKIHDNVVLVPKELGNFSGNKVQLDNDRFMAYCYMILDNPQLPADIRKMLYARALSAYWKFVKKTSRLPYLKAVFFKYLISKVNPRLPDIQYLKKMQKIFLKLPNVRRIKN